jgi:hypothetical protein
MDRVAGFKKACELNQPEVDDVWKGLTIPWGWWGFVGKYRWLSGGNWGFPNMFSFGRRANSGSPGGSPRSVWGSPLVLRFQYFGGWGSTTEISRGRALCNSTKHHFSQAKHILCLKRASLPSGGLKPPSPSLASATLLMWVQSNGGSLLMGAV